MRFSVRKFVFIFAAILLLATPLSFAYFSGTHAECLAVCKAEQDRGNANAEATAAGNQYYLGQMSGNCGSIRTSRLGEIDHCTMTYYGHPAVGINGCMQTCDADNSCAACNSGYQACCLAQDKDNYQIQYDECIAGCPAEVTDLCQGKSCTFGCDSSTGNCKPDPCIGVTCPDKCDGAEWNHNGRCGLSGQCIYAIDACPSGQVCDATSGTCKNAAQSTGACGTSEAGVAYCKAYCEADTGKSCDASAVATNTGRQLIEQCTCLCDGWTQSGSSVYYNLDCTKPIPNRKTTDACAGVVCKDMCYGDTQYKNGRCVEHGSCTYAQEIPCPNGTLCDADRKACTSQATSEICYDGIDNDANGLIDCQDPACKTNPACGPIKGRVTMIDKEGERVLFNVQVTAKWETASGSEGESTPVYTNEKGEYIISNPALNQVGTDNIFVTALISNNKNPFTVVEGTQKQVPIQSVRAVDKANWASGASQEIVLENVNKDDNTHPRDAGKIYIHTMQAADYIANVLQTTGSANLVEPETINIYDDVKGPTAAFHLNHPTVGIVFGSLISSYLSDQGPDNREYHEYGHHVMNSLMSMPNYHVENGVAVDNNHGSLENHCSADAWVEGFAEFYSLVVNSKTKVGRRCGGNEPYRHCVGPTGSNSGVLAENSLKPWDKEERAVMAILWDVYDNEATDLGPDDDSVSVDFPTLWKTLSKQRNFPVYYADDPSPRNIWYVQDLYDALKEDGIGKDGGLDAIFKDHGYYYLNESSGKTEYGALLAVKGSDGKYYLRQVLNKTDTDYYIRR